MMPKCIEKVNGLQSDVDRIEIEVEALQIQISNIYQLVGQIVNKKGDEDV